MFEIPIGLFDDPDIDTDTGVLATVTVEAATRADAVDKALERFQDALRDLESIAGSL